jgi:hypothetical protein
MEQKIVEELQEKIDFVNKLNEAITAHIRNITHIQYEVYQSTKNEAWYTEFVVVYYLGGAVQARVTSGDSCGAIFEEISKMLYSSQKFYDDQRYYKDVQEVSVRVF